MTGIPYEVKLNETFSNTTYYVGNKAGWYNIILSVYKTKKNSTMIACDSKTP